jgi:hypothetical protein
MVLLFTGVFLEFAVISSRLTMGGALISTSGIAPSVLSEANSVFTAGTAEIIFVGEDSEFILGTDSLGALLAREGSTVIPQNGVVLGAREAAMMRKEKEFTNIGDPLEEFAGKPGYIVTGILAPTGTVLDLAHITKKSNLSALPAGTVLTVIDDAGALKLFYSGDTAALPEELRTAIEGKKPVPLTKNGKIYTPIYIGFAEAAMMRENKLFQNEGDTIDGFFGNDVTIAGVLPKSDSVFDLLHYIPAGMQVAL